MTDAPNIPRYDLKEEVGSGGMSVVYRATDLNLGREVAVKVLHRHLAGRKEERGRFRREAQAVARLKHPSILEVFDYSGHEAAEAFIVSEFIRGPTLRQFADGVGLGLPDIGAMVAERIAAALAHAHEAGIIHRDVKPENVMIHDDGTVKLTDFGIARMVDRDERMTQTGALLGSPAHMPPEIIAGEPVDHRADIFSLGTVLYWMSCGAMPFTGGSPAHTLRRIMESDCADPRELDPRVSDQLARIIARAMARRPEDRHSSAEELRAELGAYLAGLGFGRPEEELVAFFEEPAGYKKSQKERLVGLLLARGAEAADSGRVAEALAALDRVLALRPEHEGARQILARMRRRKTRVNLALGAAGIVVALSAVLALLIPSGPIAPPSEPSPDQESLDSASRGDASASGERGSATNGSTPGPAAATAEDAGDARATGEVRASREAAISASGAAEVGSARPPARPREPRPPSPEPEPLVRPVRILLDTWADIDLDGERLERDREARRLLEPGEYELSINREGFVPIEETVHVSAGEDVLELRHRLVPRPAAIRVLNDQQAAVSLNDKLVGPASSGGFEIPVTFVELPDGRFEYPVDAVVRIEKPGYRMQEHRVMLRPGQVEEIQAQLEPET